MVKTQRKFVFLVFASVRDVVRPCS